MDGEDCDIPVISLFLVSAAYFAAAREAARRRGNSRRFWVRPLFRNRQIYGFNNNLIKELRSQDQEYYFDFMRMTPEVFDWILSRILPLIQQQDTFWRPSIPAQERLALTIRFLATEETYRTATFGFLMGRSTVSKIVPLVCRAIWNCFVEDFMKFPETAEKWKNIALMFRQKCQLSHCCGAVDGKHVQRECPINSGTLNHNYKGTFSSVLMALADANYKFIMIDYGHYGSESDGGIFRKTVLGQRLLNGTLNLPEHSPLPNSQIDFPHFIIGDEAFPLCENLMRPYPRSELSHAARIFNYRLCRARCVVENAFGILAARFRIFRRLLNYCDATTECIVLAACILHNILVGKSPAYVSPDVIDTENDDHLIIPGEWRNQETCLKHIGPLGSNMYSRNVKILRDRLARYLVSPAGSIPWQDAMITYRRKK